MRATVRRVPGTRKYTVWLVQGVQSFRLDYKATKGECNWMAEMFERALDANEAKAVRRLSWNKKYGKATQVERVVWTNCGPVTTCTRPKPHTCRVNGPCNGWPREGEKL